MKGAKSTRTQYDRTRKSNKRSEKSAKLDRKSSRGMIYENEELRLRTININAEVERGQSDIKRLRRENEQLRREIWTLRDECDRLNKRFKAKLNEHEFGGCRGSGGSGRRCSGGGRGSAGCDGNSDDSDSCDTCRCEDDGHCSDECCQEGGSCVLIKPPLPPEESGHQADECHAPPKPNNQPFDHLSVVSEETLSNPEMMLAHHPEHLMICTPDLNGSQSTLPSLVGPLTPLTPIELVANQLSDLQATVPPLSYFENILQQHMSHNSVLTPTPELGTSSSTTTGTTMKHTNGWDYNLQSPFSQRKYSSTSSPSRSPPPPAPPTLTTFVPTATLQALPKVALNLPANSASGGGGGSGIIETVAITTNATQQALNSPKHFFAPIKPRLKLNTKLANQNSDADALPPGSPPPETAAPLREPPDIFVNNALATPYQRPAVQRLSPQTDSVNLESILNDIETISEDILAIQLEKSKSRDNLMAQNSNDKDSAKKPYRSEMNLYLQYDATNPTLSNGTSTTTNTTTTAASHASDSSSGRKLSSRTRSLEREHTDSPAPHMPDPMAPFPEKCSYLGFEQLNQAAGVVGQSPTGQKPPVAAKPNVSAKPPPPLPPARRPAMPTEPPPTPPVGLSPNKSHLYKSLATAAAAKRAIFLSSPAQLTRSLDVECSSNEPNVVEASDATATNEDDEATRRKARRVSIVCGEEQPLASTVSAAVPAPAVTTAPTTTASCIDLTHVLTHPSIKAFKQMSHSTPSSPHSSRRRTNSNTMTAAHAEVAATNSAPPSTTHHHHHRKEISDPAPMTATVSRTKCSRRHSEGTVHNVHRISNSSGGAGAGHHHPHHHTHHHPHNSLISSNPHHSHHSHQDSNHETVTSLSDRNSNSFGSSRESSTSFSMRSNRRKISISSHTGGKIPWCGCWGNGCL